MELPTSTAPEVPIIRTEDYPYGDYPLSGSDDDSDKPSSSANAINKNALRCLLLLLPVAIPVLVYLKDIDATRRIFLVAFILFLVIAFSCMLLALVRSRSRRNPLEEEGISRIDPTGQDLHHRHIVAVTHRLLPRTFNPSSCHGLHGDVVSFSDSRRPVLGGWRASSHVPVHYHLAPARSRSPSPRRIIRTNSPGVSECGRLLAPSPSISPMHLGIFGAFSGSPNVSCCAGDTSVALRDDPPPYEEALNYPLACTMCPIGEESIEEMLSETPPPTYERVVI